MDHAIVSADRDLLLTLAVAFGLLLLLQVAINALRGWMLIKLGASLRVQARTNLFSHLVSLPASYFETRHVADVMSRFDSQEKILQALTTDLVVAFLDGLTCAITIAVMYMLSPTLATVALIGAALYGLLRWASYTPLRQASSEAIIWEARGDSHFLETLRGIKTIKLFNGQRDRLAYWVNLMIETVNRQLVTQRLDLLFRTVNALLLGVLGILIVYLAARMILENVFSIGLLIAFISYKDLFLRRVSGLIDTFVDLRMLGLHAERLADIALTAPEAQSLPRPEPKTRPPVEIEVRDLSFRYGPNDPWVLEKLNIRIGAGEWVSIAGPSGGGKTTLLKLLAGLLQPTSGVILVNGEPMARLGPEAWRGMIGVVMQDDQLFAGSIADNISFFAAGADPQRIEDCARRAAVHEDIASMPMGYDTLIGDMGTVLSGGQKQRVVLARALFREPGLLLLDEATSHLDVANETAVNAALKEMALTRIVIAHRPETILASARVITLEKGRVVSDERRAAPGLVAGEAGAPHLSDLRVRESAKAAEGSVIERAHRLRLRRNALAPVEGQGTPTVPAQEPVLGEHHGTALARKRRA